MALFKSAKRQEEDAIKEVEMLLLPNEKIDKFHTALIDYVALTDKRMVFVDREFSKTEKTIHSIAYTKITGVHIAKGGFITNAEKQAIAKQMSYYSGLSEKVIIQQNLDVPNRFFWKELLRDRGQTVGRLDYRYLSHQI